MEKSQWINEMNIIMYDYNDYYDIGNIYLIKYIKLIAIYYIRYIILKLQCSSLNIYTNVYNILYNEYANCDNIYNIHYIINILLIELEYIIKYNNTDNNIIDNTETINTLNKIILLIYEKNLMIVKDNYILFSNIKNVNINTYNFLLYDYNIKVLFLCDYFSDNKFIVHLLI
ncbi:hypothetical protein [Alphaentomopoxvirus acuprea]|uniref:Uncharacterized protein n=1 Tax=Alphaentomopoxvirus acuprea TaxID=62099 RepID=W6JIK4_9POXV|nr:hypothetical protein BA82_gp038 [Anomala cuprea entomopoxvirus]BAO49398.1 hypothetical protein [Anomala cuprea entomopoxvirus]